MLNNINNNVIMVSLDNFLNNTDIDIKNISEEEMIDIHKNIANLDNIVNNVSDLSDDQRKILEIKMQELKNDLDKLGQKYIWNKEDIIYYTQWLLEDLLWDIEDYNNWNKDVLFSAEWFIKAEEIVDSNFEWDFDEHDFIKNIESYLDKPYLNSLLKMIRIDLVSFYEKDWELIIKMKNNPKLKDIYEKYFSEDLLLKSALIDYNIEEVIEKIDFYKKYLSIENIKKLFLSLRDIDVFSNIDSIKLFEEILWIDYIKSDNFKNFLLDNMKNYTSVYYSYNLSSVVRVVEYCQFNEDFYIKAAEKNQNIFFTTRIFSLGSEELINKVFSRAIDYNFELWMKYREQLLARYYRNPKKFNNDKHNSVAVLKLCNKYLAQTIAKQNSNSFKILNKEDFLLEYWNEVFNNSTIKRESRFVNLGRNYTKFKKYFESYSDFSDFIEEQLLNKTIDISQSINDIYDYYEEREWQLNRLTREPENKRTYFKRKRIAELRKILEWHLPIDIKKEIRDELKKYSTEEIISALWNHVTNYSTTFKLMLEELDNRLDKNENIFSFINKNEKLNTKTKEFLIGQTIVWMLARGQVDRINNLINSVDDKNILWKIIKDIINYKNNDLFSEESFSWLLIGLPKLLEYNDFIRWLIKNICISKTNHKFNIWLYTVLKLSNKSSLLSEIMWWLDNIWELDNKYNWLIKYALFPNEIHEKFIEWKTNDIIMIYWWDWSWWWLERYDSEINKFKWYWYKNIKESNDINILEKDWVRVTFVNFDELQINNIKNLKWYLKKEWIDTKLVVYRWHNYYTSKMIEETWWYWKDNVILDGWCRNISKLSSYRKVWIDNQLLAYDSKWQWDDTLWVVTQYIKYIRDVRKNPNIENKIKTWNDFKNNYWGSDYAKEHIKFPWSLIDVLNRISDWEND